MQKKCVLRSKGGEKQENEEKSKKVTKKFVGMKKMLYLCTRIQSDTLN